MVCHHPKVSLYTWMAPEDAKLTERKGENITQHQRQDTCAQMQLLREAEKVRLPLTWVF